MPEKVAVICAAKSRRETFVNMLRGYKQDWTIIQFPSIKSLLEYGDFYTYIYIENNPTPVTKHKMISAIMPCRTYARYQRIILFSEFQKEAEQQEEWKRLYDAIYSSVLPQV